jgi:predicted 2-oxoglutarate/Fe(II)-dependent dioxygenase YbiX/peroxiredoxin
VAFESDLVNEWFDVGDMAPMLDLVRTDGRRRPISRMAGAPAVLHVIAPADDKTPATETMLRAFDEEDTPLRRAVARTGATLSVVRRAPPHLNLAYAKKLGVGLELLADEGGALAMNYALGDGSASLVFDKASRLHAVVRVDDPTAHGARLAAVLEAIGPTPALSEPMPAQAPVVIVPDVLTAEHCRYLIDVYRARGNEPSGFMEQRDGRSVLVEDPTVKRRRDHVIPRGSALEAEIRHVFARRLIPALARATHYEPKGHEDFKIVRYSEDEQGFFKPHRDNTTEAARTRKYAVTLNLNTGEYEGGHLVFPEYGQIGYRPRVGEAVAFSCSLLHEARPVTKGERFVLLAFWH